MARVVSLFLPSWSTDRARRRAGGRAPPPEAPLVLVGDGHGRRVVLAADARARAMGVGPGTTAAAARALAPGLVVEDADLDADQSALGRLALWLLWVAPIVAPDPPDGVVIDSTGADHLHGGEARMLDGLVGRLAMSGIHARAAVADTWGAAHALARHRAAPICVAPPGHGADILGALPVAALRPGDGILEDLRLLGIERVGDLLALPRGPLLLRFGRGLGRRIEQALGEAAEPILALRSPEPIEARRSFGEPIAAAETIARYADKLVAELCARLRGRGLGARRLAWTCQRADGRVQTVQVGLAMPVSDAGRLGRLLRDRIEVIAPGPGIEAMVLRAAVAEPLRPRQLAGPLREDGAAEGADVAELVDVLANRVGPRQVFRLAKVESDVPERSVRRVAALAEATGGGWPEHWPRPARLLAQPEPLAGVSLRADGSPASFVWRGVGRQICRVDGPERILGEWWLAAAEEALTRDYFRVEDGAGGRYWLFRSGEDAGHADRPGRWFLHGVFG